MICLPTIYDVITLSTVGAYQIAVHTAWIDSNASSALPGRFNAVITSTGLNTIVASPSSTVQRDLKSIVITNTGNLVGTYKGAKPAYEQVVVYHSDGTNAIILTNVALLPGATLTWTDRNHWHISYASSTVSSGFNKPVLNAKLSPFIRSELGGGQPMTLTGLNLSSTSSVTVGGVAATSVSSTPTSVTFTAPALTNSATPYVINVTTTYGTANLVRSYYALPASSATLLAVWYAAEGWTGTTWTDRINGIVMSSGFASGIIPPVLSSWADGQPTLTFSSAATSGLQNASSPTIVGSIGEILLYADMTTPPAGYALQVDSGSATQWAVLSDTNRYCQMFQTSTMQGSVSTAWSTTPQWVENYFHGSTSLGSFICINNGTQYPITLADGGSIGCTVGCRYDGNATVPSGLDGHISLVMFYSGTLSSGDRATLNSIVHAIY